MYVLEYTVLVYYPSSVARPDVTLVVACIHARLAFVLPYIFHYNYAAYFLYILCILFAILSPLHSPFF